MARQNQTSLSVDLSVVTTLDTRRRDGETRSSRLVADLSAYHAILSDGLRRARLALSPAEASVVLDVFNGTSPSQIWTAERMSMRVNDAIALDGVADTWGVDGPALVSTLKAIGDLPCIALADWAEGAWAKDDFDVATEAKIFKGGDGAA